MPRTTVVVVLSVLMVCGQISLTTAALLVPRGAYIGGLHVGLKNGEADLNGLCNSHGCRGKADIVGAAQRCSAAVRCRSCTMEDATRDYCANLPPPTDASLILKAGHGEHFSVLRGSFFSKNKREGERLGIVWVEREDPPIGISVCHIDDLHKSTIRKILGPTSRTPTVLHVRLVVVTTVIRVGSSLFAPSIEIRVKYNPPVEDLENGRYIGGGTCPKTDFIVPLGMSTGRLKTGEAVVAIQSITVPWDETAAIRGENFDVFIQCTGGTACDLSKYKVCFRILCQKMSQEQLETVVFLAEQKLAPALPLEPIPEIPAELLEPEPDDHVPHATEVLMSPHAPPVQQQSFSPPVTFEQLQAPSLQQGVLQAPGYAIPTIWHEGSILDRSSLQKSQPLGSQAAGSVPVRPAQYAAGAFCHVSCAPLYLVLVTLCACVFF